MEPDIDLRLPQLIAAIEEGSDESLDRVTAATALKDHLDELGDALLDHFIRQARDDGSSWTQIGEAMGITRQAAQQRSGGALDRLLARLEDGRLRRFTPRARKVVTDARSAASDRNHAAIGTEHLLLGMYGDAGSVATVALTRLGVDRAAVEQDVAERYPPGATAATGRLRFTDPARRTLELALGEALALSHNYIGTEHMVLGLVQAEGGAAAAILADRGITYEALRAACLARLAEIIGGAA
jgi:hypothetical protein